MRHCASKASSQVHESNNVVIDHKLLVWMLLGGLARLEFRFCQHNQDAFLQYRYVHRSKDVVCVTGAPSDIMSAI